MTNVESFMQAYKEENMKLIEVVDKLSAEHKETLEKIFAAINDDRNLSKNDASILLHCVIFSL